MHKKEFFRKMLAIAIPVALQNLINFGVNMMDTVMLGKLGETQLSASSLANELGFIFMIVNFGLGSGLGILTAQYWGKGDVLSVRKVLSLAYRLTVGIGIVFTVIALTVPEAVMRIFTTDQAVIAEGVRYLRIIAFTYVINGVSVTSINMLRTVGVVKISVVISSVSLVVNVFSNWVFIFGHLGAPALGIAGAALGTLIARVVEIIIVLVFMGFFERQIVFRPKDLFLKIDSQIKKNFVSYSLPVLCNETFWSVGSSMLAVIMGHIGSDMVAAASIANLVRQFAFILMQGVSSASAVITGHTIGEGDYAKAKEQARQFLLLSVAIGLVNCLVMTLLKGPVVGFYNVSDSTREMARQMITALTFICPFQSVGMVILIGMMRGGGDSKFVLVWDVGSIWLAAIPLGILTGWLLHWPAPIVFFFLRFDDVVKSIACLFRMKSGKWIRDVTKTA